MNNILDLLRMDGSQRRTFSRDFVPMPKVTTVELKHESSVENKEGFESEQKALLKKQYIARKDALKASCIAWQGSEAFKERHLKIFRKTVLFGDEYYSWEHWDAYCGGYRGVPNGFPSWECRRSPFSKLTGIPDYIFDQYKAFVTYRLNSIIPPDARYFMSLVNYIRPGADLSMIQYHLKKQFLLYAHKVYKEMVGSNVYYFCDPIVKKGIDFIDRVLEEEFEEFEGFEEIRMDIINDIYSLRKRGGEPERILLRAVRTSISAHAFRIIEEYPDPYNSDEWFLVFLNLIMNT